MSALTIHRYRYGSDNWGGLICAANGDCALVDAGDADAAARAIATHKGQLTEIWVTHNHIDHIAGIDTLAKRTECLVRTPQSFKPPCQFTFQSETISVIATPGHTLDMVNFYLPNQNALFTGDTLFVLGCGRLFEGTAQQMHTSLMTLRGLPAQTQLYCGHDYVIKNLAFARSLEPNANTKIKARWQELHTIGKEPYNSPYLAHEILSNPFLRTDDMDLHKALDMVGASSLDVFTYIRHLRDSF